MDKEKINIVAIIGSPREKGNTDILTDAALNSAKEMGANVTKVYLKDLDFKGCTGCEGCSKTKHCVINDDMQELYGLLDNCDGLILSSPTFFYNVTWLTKMFIDRLYPLDSFSKEDRGVWVSKYEVIGMKYAITIAVCEQNDIKDMGFASDAMSSALNSVGFRSVYNLKALHLFKKGEILENNQYNSSIIEDARKAGIKLFRTIKLANEIK